MEAADCWLVDGAVDVTSFVEEPGKDVVKYVLSEFGTLEGAGCWLIKEAVDVTGFMEEPKKDVTSFVDEPRKDEIKYVPSELGTLEAPMARLVEGNVVDMMRPIEVAFELLGAL